MSRVVFDYPVEEGDWIDGWDADFVIYHGDGGWPLDVEQAEKLGLVKGNRYEVELVAVDRMSSDYYLVEFPGIGFNTCMFDVVGDNSDVYDDC